MPAPSPGTSGRDTATERRSLTYMPGLDGVRGLAVVAVLLFHAGFGWAIGGWLGVSVFFTLSGYLITSSLLREHRSTGHVSVTHFWERRIRRLLPSALLTLGLVAVFSDRLVFPDQVASLRGELMSALFYVANWNSYFSNEAYSDIFGAPSPVRHFWSLSIEEQFYMVFPVVFLLAVRFFKAERAKWVFIGIALASLTATLAITGVSRTYYGTDTRVLEILVGVVLAFWHADHPGAEHDRRLRWAAWPAWIVVIVAMTRIPSYDPSVGTWLLPGFAVLSAIIAFSAIAPTGLMAMILEARPVVYVGRISYGLYLYHWPIYNLLNPRRIDATGWSLFAIRVLVTFVVAAASYSLIEMPIRQRRLLAGSRTIAFAAVLSLVGISAVALMTLRVSTPTRVAAAPPSSTTSAPLDITSTTIAPPAQPQLSTTTVAAPSRPTRILVVGDSTARAVADGLAASGAESGLAEIVEFGIPGCGVIDWGLFRHQPGPGGEVQIECTEWAETWTESINTFEPDVITVFYGPMDTMDRDVDRDGTYEWVGMPVHDAAYTQAFEAKIDNLGSAGVPILWAVPPYVWADSPRGSGNRSLTTLPERVDALDALIEDLTSADNRVELLDYGRRIDHGDPEVDFDLRPDGVHLSEEAATAISQEWLLEAILAATR